MVNAERSSLVLEDYDRVMENIPEDHPFDIGGESINLKKFIIKAFQCCRPTAVALNTLAVGIHVKPWPVAGTAFGEGPGPLLGRDAGQHYIQPIRDDDELLPDPLGDALLDTEQNHCEVGGAVLGHLVPSWRATSLRRKQMLSKLLLATKINLSAETLSMATILHAVTSSAVNKNCVWTMLIIKTTRLL